MNPVPPSAKRVPSQRSHHGDTVTDEYAWLADSKDPETIAYLEAENAYTESMTTGLADLRKAIFDEIKQTEPGHGGGCQHRRVAVVAEHDDLPLHAADVRVAPRTAGLDAPLENCARDVDRARDDARPLAV